MIVIGEHKGYGSSARDARVTTKSRSLMSSVKSREDVFASRIRVSFDPLFNHDTERFIWTTLS